MHIETQTKTPSPASNTRKFLLFPLLLSLSACSFVELQPGAQSIIFAKPGDGCESIKTFLAEVKTTTMFIARESKVVAEELQILAQNEAYALYANAIWPASEVRDGKQHFEIVNCQPNGK